MAFQIVGIDQARRVVSVRYVTANATRTNHVHDFRRTWEAPLDGQPHGPSAPVDLADGAEVRRAVRAFGTRYYGLPENDPEL